MVGPLALTCALALAVVEPPPIQRPRALEIPEAPVEPPPVAAPAPTPTPTPAPPPTTGPRSGPPVLPDPVEPVEPETPPPPVATGSAGAAPLMPPTLSKDPFAVGPAADPFLPNGSDERYPRSRARRKLPPPVHDGTGLLIGGGVVAALSFVGRFPLTLFGITSNAPELSIYFGNIVNTGFVAGVAMLGAGAGLRGDSLAYEEVWLERKAPRRAARARAIGWGIFGAGLGLWAVTRLGAMLGLSLGSCSEACAVRTFELGWYPSAIAVAVGASIGGFATSYSNAAVRYRSARRFTLAPRLEPSLAGLALAGRF